LPNLISPMHSTAISGGPATHHITPQHTTRIHTPHTHTPYAYAAYHAITQKHDGLTRPIRPIRPLEHVMPCNMARIREPGPDHGTRFTHPGDHAYLPWPDLPDPALHSTAHASTFRDLQREHVRHSANTNIRQSTAQRGAPAPGAGCSGPEGGSPRERLSRAGRERGREDRASWSILAGCSGTRRASVGSLRLLGRGAEPEEGKVRWVGGHIVGAVRLRCAGGADRVMCLCA
jgi:hypothetical protein